MHMLSVDVNVDAFVKFTSRCVSSTRCTRLLKLDADASAVLLSVLFVVRFVIVPSQHADVLYVEAQVMWWMSAQWECVVAMFMHILLNAECGCNPRVLFAS